MQRDDVTAVILAGGKATRLGGVDKRELVVGGRTIFERQVEALAPCVAEIIVSSPRPVPGYRTVADAMPGIGPIAGIAAGLAAATTPWLLVIAGDMPYMHRAFLELLLSRGDTECDAVGIRIRGLPEPLCTALRVAAWRPVVAARIAAGRFKASALLTDAALHVRWIEEPEVRAIDPDLRALHNVNAPEDL
ncbi:MAG: molybdenum cofactor guanylyltransferase [Deltaproteobacteria bacterium]|nr:MAG: molybdenum cofactor guanylyltransferase [Deltaproteobacteria bacterium]TMQ17001.1 MAG: molybdenum cofactor guanylyltransferase [Deltaproteobacteria bacterium]